jgi:hypothetical protein
MEISMTDITYIKPGEIEKFLSSIREKNQNENVIRASLFNLIIYAKKNMREEYIQKITKSIIKKYPCRMIFITEFDEKEGNFLRTYVTEMVPEKNKNPIFCDIINFEVAGSFIERIPFVILPHLLADRPVYLLWGDDPTKKNPISLKLENFATRSVFDSETAKHMTDFAKTLLNLHDSLSCDIGDLNWARTAPWRALLAQAFNTPERLLCLQEAKNIRITYNLPSADEFSHLQAWLAVKMNWDFDTVLGTKEELCFKYHTEHGPLEVRLSPGHRESLTSGRIISIDIISHQSDHIHFDRDHAHPSKILIHRSSSSVCEMPVHHMFDSDAAGKSLIYEIYSQGTSESFLKALKLISRCQYGVICSC